LRVGSPAEWIDADGLQAGNEGGNEATSENPRPRPLEGMRLGGRHASEDPGADPGSTVNKATSAEKPRIGFQSQEGSEDSNSHGRDEQQGSWKCAWPEPKAEPKGDEA